MSKDVPIVTPEIWNNKFDDLSGLEFGELKVTSQWERRRMKNLSRTEIYWLCKCSCGVSKWIMGASLKHANTKSCGRSIHKPPQVEDLSGRVFSRLIVVDEWKKVSGRVRWKCICECGNEKWIDASNLKSGKVVSCGCLQRENRSKRRKYPTHNVPCAYCGKEFKTRTGQSIGIEKGWKVYCSKECLLAANRSRRLDRARQERITKENKGNKRTLSGTTENCLRCGKEIYVMPSQKGKRKYCSVECVRQRFKRICPYCCKEYEVKPYNIKNGTGKKENLRTAGEHHLDHALLDARHRGS